MTDALRMQCMGLVPEKRWYDLVGQGPAQEIDGDEIADSIIRRLGLVAK